MMTHTDSIIINLDPFPVQFHQFLSVLVANHVLQMMAAIRHSVNLFQPLTLLGTGTESSCSAGISFLTSFTARHNKRLHIAQAGNMRKERFG